MSCADSLEVIALEIERIQNLVGALALPLPDSMHVEQMKRQLPSVSANLKAAYIAAGGADVWATHPA